MQGVIIIAVAAVLLPVVIRLLLELEKSLSEGSPKRRVAVAK